MQNRADSEKSEQASQPPMCQTNCGFFANPSFNGYCSKCYKDMIALEEKKMMTLPSSSKEPCSPISESENIPLSLSSVTPLHNKGGVDICAVPTSTSPPTPVNHTDQPMQMEVDAVLSGATPVKQLRSSSGAEMDKVSPKTDNLDVLGQQSSEGVYVQQQQQQQPQIQTQVLQMEGQQQGGNEKPVQTNKKRCWQCQKKVGIQGVQCRCGYTFCFNHRQPEEHSCDFDFRGFDRKRLASNNPQVIGSKMDHRV